MIHGSGTRVGLRSDSAHFGESDRGGPEISPSSMKGGCIVISTLYEPTINDRDARYWGTKPRHLLQTPSMPERYRRWKRASVEPKRPQILPIQGQSGSTGIRHPSQFLIETLRISINNYYAEKIIHTFEKIHPTFNQELSQKHFQSSPVCIPSPPVSRGRGTSPISRQVSNILALDQIKTSDHGDQPFVSRPRHLQPSSREKGSPTFPGKHLATKKTLKRNRNVARATGYGGSSTERPDLAGALVGRETRGCGVPGPYPKARFGPAQRTRQEKEEKLENTRGPQGC